MPLSRRTAAFGFGAALLVTCGGRVANPEVAPPVAAVVADTTTPPIPSGPDETPGSTIVPATVTTTESAREPVVLGFAGDTSFVGWEPGDEPLALVSEILSSPDLMIVNLETSIADPSVGEPPVEKMYLFKSPPGSLDQLVAAGVDVVALGNNHTRDFGPDALSQTLDEIDARGLLRTGAGRTQSEAYEPLLVEVGDWTVGLVSLSRVPCDWSIGGENTRPEVAWVCDQFLNLADRAVVEAQESADLVVVMVHGGTEGTMCPAEHMVELRRHFSELGVELMVDGHPHVVQGLSSFGDTMVISSTGNFAFPAARSFSANSAVFSVTLSEEGLELRVIPVRGPGGVVSPATDAQWEEIIAQINDFSVGWTVDPDGLARRTPMGSDPCPA